MALAAAAAAAAAALAAAAAAVVVAVVVVEAVECGDGGCCGHVFNVFVFMCACYVLFVAFVLTEHEN